MIKEDEFLTLNKSVTAPIDGIYKYVLLPAENPINYYIDLFYVYGQGPDDELLESMEDTVYLKNGEWLTIDSDGNVKVQQKERHLKLVVANE